jgi:hypothetical protein
MADTDIVVSVGADTSDFDSAIVQSAERAKARFYGWTAQLGDQPRLEGPKPPFYGWTPQLGDQPMLGAGKQWQDTSHTKWYSDYMKEATEATQAQVNFNKSVEQGVQSQKMFGLSMDQVQQLITRVILRYIAYEIVIRSVINAVNAAKQAFDNMITGEALITRFDILTTKAQSLDAVFDQIRASAEATGRPVEEMVAGTLELEKGGMSAENAARSVGVLGYMADVAGENVVKLADQMHKVRLHESSVSDMRSLVLLAGEGKEALINQINAYEELLANEKRYNRQVEETNRAEDRRNELMERSLTLQQQQISRENELAERVQQNNQRQLEMQRLIADREYQLETRRIEAANRLRDAQMGFAQKAGIDYSQQLQQTGGSFLSPNRAASASKLPYNIAMDLAIQQQKELERGEQQIQTEEGLRADQLQQLIKARVVGQEDILAAAKRSHEEEERQREYAHEDQQFQRSMQRMALEQQAAQRQYNMADERYQAEQTRDQLQDQRRQQLWNRQDAQNAHQVEIDNARITIENNLTAALTNSKNVMDMIQKYSATFAANMAKATQSAKDFSSFDLGKFLKAAGEQEGQGLPGAPGAQAAMQQTLGEADRRAVDQKLLSTLDGVQHALDNINKNFQ